MLMDFFYLSCVLLGPDRSTHSRAINPEERRWVRIRADFFRERDVGWEWASDGSEAV